MAARAASRLKFVTEIATLPAPLLPTDGARRNARTTASRSGDAANSFAFASSSATGMSLENAPLVAPMGLAFGIDPVHLGVIFLANLELGFLFPPVGLNLFLSSSRFGKPLPQLYRHVGPFLLILGAGVLLITYLPQMSLGLLGALGRR